MNIFYFIFGLINVSLINCDSIKYISPMINETVINSNLNVTYFVMRNGLLYLTDSKLELFDNNNTLIQNTSVMIDTGNLVVTTLYNLSNSNYFLKITSSGLYNSVKNGSFVKLPLSIENVIPFTVKAPDAIVTIMTPSKSNNIYISFISLITITMLMLI